MRTRVNIFFLSIFTLFLGAGVLVQAKPSICVSFFTINLQKLSSHSVTNEQSRDFVLQDNSSHSKEHHGRSGGSAIESEKEEKEEKDDTHVSFKKYIRNTQPLGFIPYLFLLKDFSHSNQEYLPSHKRFYCFTSHLLHLLFQVFRI